MLQIQEKALNFLMRTPEGERDLYQWLGNKWGILFSHSRNFLFSTDVGNSRFGSPRAEIKAFSVIYRPLDPGTLLQVQPNNFPLVTASDNILEAYAISRRLAGSEMGPRAAFVLDPNKIVRLVKLLPGAPDREQRELADMVAYTILLQQET